MSRGASRLSRFLRAPIRALGRARDLYVRSMNDCARGIQPGHGVAVSHPIMGGVSRSFSFHSNSGEEDIRELIRAASQNWAAEQKVPRSQSAVVGRINEDGPSEFGDVDVMVGMNLLFPRSQSYAVPVRRDVPARRIVGIIF